MEGYSSGSVGATSGGGTGYPQPAARTSHNRSFNVNSDSGYAATNGMLSRPTLPSTGNIPASRQDSLQGLASSTTSGVLMVREASRPTAPGRDTSMSERSPFASSGNRFQDESGGGSGGERSHHRTSESLGSGFALPKMLKIAVVGDSTSGKTAICNAFTSEGYSFSRNYHMTTGVSVFSKSVRLPGAPVPPQDSLDLEPRINLVLVDSAGKPIYRELLPQYWDRLDGLALVIDLTSSTALETASEWLQLAKGCIAPTSSNSNSDNPSRPGNHPPSDGSGDSSKPSGELCAFSLGVLIGSKNDLSEQRVISPKSAEDFATRHGLQYFECSAKENSGIEEPFFFLAHQWTTKSSQSPGGLLLDKENLEDGEGPGFSSSSSGGVRIAAGGGRTSGGGNGNPSASNRKSAFQSRQNSSSDAF